MYYYSTMNEIVTSHSEVLTEDGFEYIKVHYERPNATGFDFLDLKVPGAFTVGSFGFSEDEILNLKEYARDNEPLFWEFARDGGGGHT